MSVEVFMVIGWAYRDCSERVEREDDYYMLIVDADLESDQLESRRVGSNSRAFAWRCSKPAQMINNLIQDRNVMSRADPPVGKSNQAVLVVVGKGGNSCTPC